MKVILPLLLLTAAPQVFASQCNTQTQSQAVDHKALYDTFKANLISVKQKFDQSDKNTRDALNELFKIQSSPKVIHEISDNINDFFEELGILNQDSSINDDMWQTIIEHNQIQTIAPERNSFTQLSIALLIEFNVLDKNGQLIGERSYNDDDIKGYLLVGGNTQEN